MRSSHRRLACSFLLLASAAIAIQAQQQQHRAPNSGLHNPLHRFNVASARWHDGPPKAPSATTAFSTASSVLRLDVQPRTLEGAGGQWFTVTWSGVQGPAEGDLLALYVPADADITQAAPVKVGRPGCSCKQCWQADALQAGERGRNPTSRCIWVTTCCSHSMMCSARSAQEGVWELWDAAAESSTACSQHGVPLLLSRVLAVCGSAVQVLCARDPRAPHNRQRQRQVRGSERVRCVAAEPTFSWLLGVDKQACPVYIW